LEDFAEEKAPREEEEDNVAYSFAGVELEVECSLCGGQGVVPSEAWSKWTKQWLDGEKLDPILMRRMLCGVRYVTGKDAL